MVLYRVLLERKNYHSSDVFKFSKIPYDDLLRYLRDENLKMKFNVEGFDIFVDNNEKFVQVESL